MLPNLYLVHIFFLNLLYIALGWDDVENGNGSRLSKREGAEKDWLIPKLEIAKALHTVSINVQQTLEDGSLRMKYCAGTYFMSPYYVLTAAHCLIKEFKKPLKYGQLEDYELAFGTGGEQRGVQFMRPHRLFLPSGIVGSPYDIAVMMADKELVEGDTIKFLPLPPLGIVDDINRMMEAKSNCSVIDSSSKKQIKMDMAQLGTCSGKTDRFSYEYQLCTDLKGSLAETSEGAGLACELIQHILGVYSGKIGNSSALIVRVDRHIDFINRAVRDGPYLKDRAAAKSASAPRVLIRFPFLALLYAGFYFSLKSFKLKTKIIFYNALSILTSYTLFDIAT